MNQPLLKVENLVRHYERPRKSLFSKKPVVEALNGVSFTVHQGESFGIVGESGSGKSTLARAILALEEPTSGGVRFKGESMFDMTTERKLAARRQVQMVFQDPFGSLDPKHDVRRIVSEPLALVGGISATEQEAKAAEALIDVGLEAGDLDKYPHEFSGGQRQRIAIARALITRPDLIVADEPVSALDAEVQAQILDLMMDLQTQFDLTYIIITHDLSVVRGVTDRVAVMKSGVIVEQGDTGQIFDSPRHAYTRDLLQSSLEAEFATEDHASEDRDGDLSTSMLDVKPSAKPTINTKTAVKAADAAIATAIASVRKPSAGDPGEQSASMQAKTDSPAQSDVTERVEDTLITDEEMSPIEINDQDQVIAEGPKPAPLTSLPSPADPIGDGAVATHRTDDRPTMIQGQNLIGGTWLDASDDRLIEVTNPSDGRTLGHIARGTPADIDRAVKTARHALEGPWGRLPAFERGRLLSALAQAVLDKVDHLAKLEAMDVGKPLRQARADVFALARYFEFYGGAADKIHGETIPYHDGYTVLTLREPHGVTGHIVPWNYPMQIIGRSVGAALAMGNACVLKPGEDASLTALEIGKLALDAGLPPGVLNVVTGLGEEAGAALAAHPGVDHISFTGSVETGRRVQMVAGGHNCPVTLELGGKSPQIVFADADLDQALPFLTNAAIQNAGQTCSAGSRVLIQDWIYDEVTHRLADRFNNLVVGPAEHDLDCGPVISPVQKRRIESYLGRAQEDDIAVLGEGMLAPDAPENGHYVKPTLFGNVPADHALAREEVFGPVLSAIRFSSEEDAIRLANDSDYGLVAGIWTRDGARQIRLARAIKSGQVFINNYGAGGGVELPFGGVKNSGFGREKGFEALYGFSTLKTVAIRHG